MGSQPPLLSGSDCVKLDRVEVKGNTPSSQHDGLTESARKPGVFQLVTSPNKEERMNVRLLATADGPHGMKTQQESFSKLIHPRALFQRQPVVKRLVKSTIML